jgi:hypothetical protein
MTCRVGPQEARRGGRGAPCAEGIMLSRLTKKKKKISSRRIIHLFQLQNPKQRPIYIFFSAANLRQVYGHGINTS